MTNSSTADDIRTVRYSRGKCGELFSGSQNRRSANRRASFPECRFIGFDDAEFQKSEVAHTSSNGAEVEGIARAYENYAEAIEYGGR